MFETDLIQKPRADNSWGIETMMPGLKDERGYDFERAQLLEGKFFLFKESVKLRG
jgi:hypothetical protein